ncbi:MAG: hypothetical protein FWD49_00155 [Firmicutes bacterium]|nr:hypothetical protein [Bacillota bacterium]
MKFEKCIENIGTTLDLKRIASAYVVDGKNLSDDELRKALLKTAGQYFDKNNIQKRLKELLLADKRDDRMLSYMILREILLNKDDFMQEQKVLDSEIIAYEQRIVDASNELDEKAISTDMQFLKFVLDVAWESGGEISPDEKNLIENIRKRLNITWREYKILEAKMGKFPKQNNEVHLTSEIDAVRKTLQRCGLIFSIRNNSVNFDIIPEEIAAVLREVYAKEMKDFGYKQLLGSKYIKSKDFLTNALIRANIKCNPYATISQLQDLIIERIKPTNLIGGYSPKDGLAKEVLAQWCIDLKLQNFANCTKEEIIRRIIKYYDDIREIKVDTSDPREALFALYEHLAKRDLKHLRQQGIICKDLECERKFEEATSYMFEKLFRHKPLLLAGTERPDGILSYQNKLIMWDNKSKETPVRLKDHIAQFDRYINLSDKPVGIFMVIATDFTECSIAECAKHALNSDTVILLVRATDIKELALQWRAKNDEASFNLGYFKQNGIFKKDHILF